MTDRCDFFEQENLTTEEGRLRPDMVVRLPGGKNVVVDSKAPLKAYLEALERRPTTMPGAKLKDHAAQVRKHVDQLSSKAYWERANRRPNSSYCFCPARCFSAPRSQQDAALDGRRVGAKSYPGDADHADGGVARGRPTAGGRNNSRRTRSGSATSARNSRADRDDGRALTIWESSSTRGDAEYNRTVERCRKPACCGQCGNSSELGVASKTRSEGVRADRQRRRASFPRPNRRLAFAQRLKTSSAECRADLRSIRFRRWRRRRLELSRS